jgi:hypothetical protein
MASDTAAAAAASSNGGDARVISLDEMRKHTTEESCWIAVRGEVFDVTPFIDEHPGGFDIIISNTGKRGGERGREEEMESMNRWAHRRNRVLLHGFSRVVSEPLLRISSIFIGTRARNRPIVLPWRGWMDKRKRKSASKQALKGGQLFFFFFISTIATSSRATPFLLSFFPLNNTNEQPKKRKTNRQGRHRGL